tara:strand:+ start:3762 stop:6377 length:2616 start_codon:yes stop_codon:yes gene_type:complete
MARTLEREEESRIEELERLAREGDGVDKLIAEMQLTEERKGAIEAEGLALQAEADAPKGKADDMLTPEDTFLKPFKKEGKKGGKKRQVDMPTVEEMFPAGKDVFTEEEFQKKFGWSKDKGMRRVEEQRQDKLAVENSVRQAVLANQLRVQNEKSKAAKGEIAIKSAEAEAERNERLKKNILEKYPRATISQKLTELGTFGLLSPATKANVKSAEALGAAFSDYESTMKLNNAASSAKSSSVERSLSNAQIGNIADVTAGWASAKNRAFRASEVVAGRTPASFRILNLPPNSTVEKQDAAMQNTLRLAHLGNKYAQMDVASLAAVAKMTADFQKTKSDAAAAALVKETDRAATEQGNHYKAIGAEYAARASVEGGRFSMESLSPDLKAVAYVGDPKDNILSVKGGYIRSGGQGFITKEAIERSTAVSDQLAKGAPTAQALIAQREALTGVEGVKWENLTRSQQFNLTNPANITATKEELDAIKAFREASGVQPPHFANAAKHRDEVVAMKINAEEELASIDKELGDPSTSNARKVVLSAKKAWMNKGLRGLNRNVQKAESEVISAISDMKRDTADMAAETTAGKKRKETKEMALWDIGQKNMELFRKHIAPNTWEQQNRARALEGKMKGLNAYEWTFFETNAEGKPIDVREVFKPWLTMRTQSARGGTPDDPKGGGVDYLPNWGTRVSNGLFWDEDTLSNRRIIDAEKKIYPKRLGADGEEVKGPKVPVQEYFEQREAYRTAQAEWNRENGSETTSTPSRAEVIASAPPTAPALTTPAEPLTVPMAPAPVPVAPEVVSTPPPPATPEEIPLIELEATNVMEGVRADASGRPYKDGDAVKFSDPRYPESVRGRTFIFKTDSVWGNPYWLLKPE